jgi:hypothetical protein
LGTFRPRTAFVLKRGSRTYSPPAILPTTGRISGERK